MVYVKLDIMSMQLRLRSAELQLQIVRRTSIILLRSGVFYL